MFLIRWGGGWGWGGGFELPHCISGGLVRVSISPLCFWFCSWRSSFASRACNITTSCCVSDSPRKFHIYGFWFLSISVLGVFRIFGSSFCCDSSYSGLLDICNCCAISPYCFRVMAVCSFCAPIIVSAPTRIPSWIGRPVLVAHTGLETGFPRHVG